MKIKEARTKALIEKAAHMKGPELMSAFLYIANSADVARMADVLEVEHEAKKIKTKS